MTAPSIIFTRQCQHAAGYWINRNAGQFRCIGCGFQYNISEVPERERKIVDWRPVEMRPCPGCGDPTPKEEHQCYTCAQQEAREDRAREVVIMTEAEAIEQDWPE